MAKKTQLDWKLHPIQLNYVGVRELSIIAHVPPSEETEVDTDAAKIGVGSSDFSEDTKTIMVGIKLHIGENGENKQPYSLVVEVIGEFSVDLERVEKTQVIDWASKNAPLVLMPFLREHAFALTSRSGFKPLLLPLVEVPTYKFSEKKRK